MSSGSTSHSTTLDDTPRESPPNEQASLATQTQDVGMLFASVRTALASSAKNAVFTIGGTLNGNAFDRRDTATSPGTQSAISGPVTVRWDSGEQAHGRKVTFPVPQAEEPQTAFAHLVQDCQPATFGRNNQDVFDETYRKAGKMDESAFSSNFNPYEHGIIDIVLQSLAHVEKSSNVNRGVRAELYKLNIYSAPSGKFKPHVDTPRSEQQMGSLVVCLPHPHKGGQLAVRHQDQQVIYDWSCDDPTQIQWAAFFSDCEHEVFEVTEGHRVTLTYNLYWTPYGPASMSDQAGAFDEESLSFYSSLERLFNCRDFLPKGGRVGFTCTHAYPHTSDSRVEDLQHGLKGIDMLLYQALKRLVGVEAVSVRTVLQDDGRVSHGQGYTYRYSSNNDDEESVCFRPESTVLSRPYPTMLYEPFPLTDESTDPTTIVRTIMINDESRKVYQYIRSGVTWLNHKPGRSDNKELAVALLTYGNEPSLGSLYSSMVVMAKVGGFTDSDSGRRKY